MTAKDTSMKLFRYTDLIEKKCFAIESSKYQFDEFACLAQMFRRSVFIKIVPLNIMAAMEPVFLICI